MDVDAIIKKRKTEKVLANSTWEISQDQEKLHKTIDDLLELAAHAPFHKKCDVIHVERSDLKSCIPWRAYVLDTVNCRLLYDHIEKENIKAGKISNMLAAADALIMITWLPDSFETKNKSEVCETDFEGSLKNMEHIAAASAAIQNILLGATSRNIPNYWSSGGQLRLPELREYLNISLQEVLLGAIFLFPEDINKPNTIVKSGLMRESGKELSTWSKRIDLNL